MAATSTSAGEISTSDILSPLNKKERILFLDCTRGIALLGILLMNSMAQGQPHFFYEFMNLNQPLKGLNFYAWVVERGFFEGTMRGLFSILFGAGTILLLSRLQKQKSGIEPADIFYRRMLWLLAFGLINAFLFLWPGDILYPYALLGLLLFPFRNWNTKKLLWGVLFLLVLGTYRENRMLYDTKDVITKGQLAENLETKKQKLTEEQQGDLKKWQGFKEENTSAGMMKKAMSETKKVQEKRHSYVSMVKYYRDINMMIESVFFYNGWWDMLMFFFLGIALLKSGFLEGKRSTALYVAVTIIGIGVGVYLNYILLKSEYGNRFDVVVLTQKWNISYYQIRRLFQTMGYLSLLILLYKIIPFRKILHIFAPVGQMAFTNYLMQSIITSIIFYGMGWFGQFQRYQIYYVVLGIWVFQIIFSTIWLRYFLFGPFEWLWRSLTYLRKQPFIRKRQSAPLQEGMM
ncbi:MAG: DUF418 domain-containing protein [Bacteroidota bacterium]|nr:DUF418 domain-containing protein [Bacteroidota bacterium]